MKDQTFQIQRMLADELDTYRRRGNSYVDNNIWEIQELYNLNLHHQQQSQAS